METVFRKEIKYLISRGEAMILQQKLDSIMERDIHGENGRYFIRSQYYDSIDDQDLWDNLDGMYEKRKIRLRIYSLTVFADHTGLLSPKDDHRLSEAGICLSCR